MRQTAETYRKIRNTFRFLLGNLFDFHYETDRVKYEQMAEVDQYLINDLNVLVEKVLNAYENYAFDEVNRLIVTYMTNDLSAFYLDFTKDVLYIETTDNPARRSIQTVFYENLKALACLLTPIIPHTTEEVYSYVLDRSQKSIYLLDMPKITKYANSSELLQKYGDFLKLRDDVLKALELARNEKIIGKSFSSKVVIYPTEKAKKLLNSINDDVAKIFIVSEFVISNDPIEGSETESGIIQVTAREGKVCSRCWKVVDHLSDDELCERCDKIIKSLEEK
ncbi:MAG TPA: hypothetical protein DD618_01975 [Acholeplasmatales bacterium]|nr:hypothetical protein [Acholeplasmatales bacterium]